MITYGNIYLITSNFEKAVDFYKKLFEKDVESQNKTRFAIFNINGLGLSIMNGKFDKENPQEVIHKGQYCELYDDMDKIMGMENPGKIVINLCTEDLKREYQRIKKLNIGSNMTEIRYVNARMPYYYFSVKDIDGNTIEITGNYVIADGEKVLSILPFQLLIAGPVVRFLFRKGFPQGKVLA